MLLFGALIILYGIPALLIIWVSYGTAKKRVGKKTAIKSRNTLLVILGVGFVVILLIDYFSRRHWVEFTLNGKYELNILAIELESFLDAPTEFQLSFKEIENKETIDFKIFTGEGPQIKFLLIDENEDLVAIEGYDQNVFCNWLIDLKNKTIEEGGYDGNFQESARLELDYEIKKIK